jgi:hypothetical protein
VLHDNNAKKEDLKARAVALKILGKTFQVCNLNSSWHIYMAVLHFWYASTFMIFKSNVLIWNTNKGKKSYCQGHKKRLYLTMTAAQMKIQMMMWLERCHIGLLHLIRQVFNYY